MRSGSDELNSWYVAVTRARLELQLPDKFWALYDAVWKGEVEWDKYSPADQRGIKRLLERMRGDRSLAGAEPLPAVAAAGAPSGADPAAALPGSPSGASQVMAHMDVAIA